CLIYRDSSLLSFTISSLLAVGIFLSYVPQHVRIYQRQTSEGISPFFLLLGTMSGFSALLNVVMLTQMLRDCCSSLSWFDCANSQLGLIQVAAQATAAALILVLCVHFTRGSPFQMLAEYAKLVSIYRVCSAYLLVSAIFVIYPLVWAPGLVTPVANFQGLFATVLASIQYFPQIYTTWRLKHAGSLSMNMMLIQTPGGFLWATTMILRPGSVWSTWLPYLAAASLQAVLLSLCVWFSITKPIE
ncbi:hypothetical protein BABINDRAFT_16763, partial [Babjeviella inositovora NRRL Y-12698]